VKALRRAPEAELLGHRDELPELPQVHAVIYPGYHAFRKLILDILQFGFNHPDCDDARFCTPRLIRKALDAAMQHKNWQVETS
jgi:hypothetical protein